MYGAKLFITFLLFILGVIGALLPIIVLLRYKRAGVKLRSHPKKFSFKIFSVLIVSAIITLGSLFWLINFHPFDNYFSTLKDAISEYGFGNYKCFGRIDTDLISKPIIIVERKNDNELCVVNIQTKKSLFGFTKYYIDGHTCILSENRLYIANHDDVIIEDSVYDYEDIWFGIIHPDKRDKIQINGKVPNFHDINFKGENYVFWYIEKSGSKADMIFQ